MIATATATQGIAAHLANVTLPGPIRTLIEVGDGAVIVCDTPDSEWGTFEVTSWRPRAQWEIDTDRAEWPGEDAPQIAYVTAHTLQDADGIDAALSAATAALLDRLATDATR
jgi:hypothetical protein